MPLDDNLALYDGDGQQLILLNTGAAAVWTRCDGATTFGDIVADLEQTHEGDVGLITGDAWHTVRKLAGLGLLEEPADDATPA